ncbi:TPA: hypothetical protein ACG5JQ_001687 [Stenotrophomonas maltophilia]
MVLWHHVVMAVTYYFLDTEWSDVLGAELVSLALVREDGEQDFYAERADLSETPTDFVRQAVYPLLTRGNAAMSDAALTTALRAFLGSVATPAVMADYPNDLHLLQYALDGFELPDEQAAACGPIPTPILTRMLKDGLTGMLVEDWFAAHPEQNAKRHHALADAQALRMAWLVATDRLPPPAWAKSYRRLRV